MGAEERWTTYSSQSLKDLTGIPEKNKEQRTKEVCPKPDELTIALWPAEF